MSYKVGDWIAVVKDRVVYTGQVTGVRIVKGETRYEVDVVADNTYISRVS